MLSGYYSDDDDDYGYPEDGVSFAAHSTARKARPLPPTATTSMKLSTAHLKVSPSVIGLVVGKSGANLKGTQSKWGVCCELQDANRGRGCPCQRGGSCLHISGPLSSVKSAVAATNRMLRDMRKPECGAAEYEDLKGADAERTKKVLQSGRGPQQEQAASRPSQRGGGGSLSTNRVQRASKGAVAAAEQRRLLAAEALQAALFSSNTALLEAQIIGAEKVGVAHELVRQAEEILGSLKASLKNSVRPSSCATGIEPQRLTPLPHASNAAITKCMVRFRMAGPEATLCSLRLSRCIQLLKARLRGAPFLGTSCSCVARRTSAADYSAPLWKMTGPTSRSFSNSKRAHAVTGCSIGSACTSWSLCTPTGGRHQPNKDRRR